MGWNWPNNSYFYIVGHEDMSFGIIETAKRWCEDNLGWILDWTTEGTAEKTEWIGGYFRIREHHIKKS